MFGLRRKAVDWEAIVARFGDAVVVEPGCEVHGVVEGVALRLRFDRQTQLTTIETTLAFERFSLRIMPRVEGPRRVEGARSARQSKSPGGDVDFDVAFVVVASPTDLPRLVIDDHVRGRMLAIEPRPTVDLAPPMLSLEVEGLLDTAAAIAALEVIARLAGSLAERAAMCARG
jgi:hypothetical protein